LRIFMILAESMIKQGWANWKAIFYYLRDPWRVTGVNAGSSVMRPNEKSRLGEPDESG